MEGGGVSRSWVVVVVVVVRRPRGLDGDVPLELLVEVLQRGLVLHELLVPRVLVGGPQPLVVHERLEVAHHLALDALEAAGEQQHHLDNLLVARDVLEDRLPELALLGAPPAEQLAAAAEDRAGATVDRRLDVVEGRRHRDGRDRELDVDVEEGALDEEEAWRGGGGGGERGGGGG